MRIASTGIGLSKGQTRARESLERRRSRLLQLERLEPRLVLASFFVSPSGNDNHAGTLAAPFATIARALELAQPGDDVLLRGGIYRETIASVRSGLPGQPITIGNYNGESAVISATDVVSGPWTETVPGSGIYSASTSGSLPVRFWDASAPTGAGTRVEELGGKLVVTVANDAPLRTATMRSMASSDSWNFFAHSVTWQIRGLSLTNSGSTALPLDKATAYFTIMNSSGSGYSSDDSVSVRYNGLGNLALLLKRNTPNSWGINVGSVTDGTITGFDLTLGPGAPGNVSYKLAAFPSGQTIASGNWGVSQSDWTDGGTGSRSFLQVFAQEGVSTAIDPKQQFQLKVDSYVVRRGSLAVLRDEFSDGDLVNADSFPAGRNTAVSSGLDQFFVDGEMQHEARYGNKLSADLLEPEGVSFQLDNTYRLTGDAFSGQPNGFFAGARFLGRAGQGWSWQSAEVTSSGNNWLQLAPSTASTWWWPNQDNKSSDLGTGYVYGKLQFLDADREWYLKQNASGPDKLYLRIANGSDPTRSLVEQKTRNWTVSIDGHNHIIVRGLDLRGGAVRLNGSYLILEDCTAQYLSHFLTFSQGGTVNGGRPQGGGVVISGEQNIVRGCEIYDTAGSGIVASGTGHLLTRNHIHHTDYSGTYATGISLTGSSHIATFNTIHDSGRDVLRPAGSGLTVMYNDLARAGRMALDLGTVYTIGTSGRDANGKSTRIAYNWIHEHGNPADPASRGIYLDNYSRDFLIDHNVIWDMGQTSSGQSGIKLNSPTFGNQILHNTIVDGHSYNLSTWTPFPENNPDPTFWTTATHAMDYVAQNNLFVSSTEADLIFEDFAENDFRPLPGSTAVDPEWHAGVVTWETTNGQTGVPTNFKLTMKNKNQRFNYREVTGEGVALEGLNDDFAGMTPDNGAYELGLPRWTAGVDGFAVGEFGAEYAVGFQWNRQSDWTIGPAADMGTTAGNPDRDSLGAPVWSYESVPAGGARGQTDVWYEQPPTRLLWIPAGPGNPNGAWATDSSASSAVRKSELTHSRTAATIPIVRWSNPLPSSVAIDIQGVLTPGWSNGVQGDVDVVLLKQLSNGSLVSLLQVVRQATDGPTARSIPVDLREVTVGAGESILVSIRHQIGRANSGSVILSDDLTITLKRVFSSKTYYVATTGSDNQAGSLAQPFRTISKAAAVMRPGDRTLIRGGTYRETVIPASDNVYFGAYKSEHVVISGSDVVSATWQSHKGNILRVASAMPVLDVFVDGVKMNLAAYPNFKPNQDMLSYGNWASTTTSTPKLSNGKPALGTGYVAFSSMPSVPSGYWVGGYYTGRNGSDPSAAARGLITASSGRTITLGELNYSWRESATTATAVGSGKGYIINHLNALDSVSEWYWGNGTLYVYGPSGIALPTATVEARTRLWGMDLSNRTGIVVEGLDFHTASILLENAHYSEIRDAEILYPSPWSGRDIPSPIDGRLVGLDYGGPHDGSTGLYVSGSHNRILRSRIAHSWGGGIRLDGRDNSIESSYLEDLNWFGRRIGAVQVLGIDNHVLGNIVSRTGQAGIDAGNRLMGFGKVGYGIDVRYNDVRDVGMLTSDTAHFYINNQGAVDSLGQASLVNAVIAYNTFINNYSKQNGAGIYFDRGTSGALIHHNVVAGKGISFGIKLANNSGNGSGIREIYVYNDTVIGGSKGISVTGSSGPVKSVVYRNNLTTKGVSGATTASHNKTATSSWFVNPSAHDYRLRSTATAAIDAALAIPGITDDLVGPAPDLGAYEFR